MSHTASHSFLSVAALHHADEDKFERHLISVARKCQDQDDAVDKALQEVEEAEEKRFPQKRIMNNYISMMLQSDLYIYISKDITSSTAQGGGGSFKKRKTIGEIGCCESQMSKQKH